MADLITTREKLAQAKTKGTKADKITVGPLSGRDKLRMVCTSDDIEIANLIFYMPLNPKKSIQANWSETSNKPGEFSDIVELGLDTVTQQVQSLLQQGSKEFQLAQQGLVQRPWKEFVFEAVSPRAYTFSFRLSPESETESNNIKKAVKQIELGMLPDVLQGDDVVYQNYLQTPGVWKVEFVSVLGGDDNYFKINDCALTNMEVLYGEGSTHQTFPDGSPTYTEITLTFQELRRITRSAVNGE